MAPAALVIGAEGLIGSQLLRLARAAGWQTVGASRHPADGSQLLPFDLADPAEQLLRAPAVREIWARPGWGAFLMAGITGYDRCAGDPSGTRHINVISTVGLAGALLAAGAFVVFPSSTAVFGQATGAMTESSPTSPTTEYGRQKAEAEHALLDLASGAPEGAGVAVVRLSKVLAATGIVGQWLDTLRSDGAIDAAINLCLSPISLAFAARGLLDIARGRRSGVYHLAGEHMLTYFDLAQRLAAALCADPARVRPVEIELQESTTVGNNTSLSMAETSQHTTLAPQPLDQAVDDLISSVSVSRSH